MQHNSQYPIHQNGMYSLLSETSNSVPINNGEDPYMKANRLPESNYDTNDSLDVFICGRCSYQFKDMCYFMNHKQSCCGRNISVSQAETVYNHQYPYNSQPTLHDKHHQNSSLHVMMGSGMPAGPNMLSESNSHQNYNQSALEQLNMDNGCETGLEPGNLTRQLLVDRNASEISDISIATGDNFLEVPTANDEALLFGDDKDNEVFSFLQPHSNPVYGHTQHKVNANIDNCNQSGVIAKTNGHSQHYEVHNQQTIVAPSLHYPMHENNLQRPPETYLTQNSHPSYQTSYHNPHTGYQSTSHQEYHEMLPPPGLQNSSFASDLLSAAPLPNNNIIPQHYYPHHHQPYQQPHRPHEDFVNVMHAEHTGGYLPPISEIPLNGKCSNSNDLALVNPANISISVINGQSQVINNIIPTINALPNLLAEPTLNDIAKNVNANISDVAPINRKQKSVLYKCQYCERGFSKNYDLEQHERSHTGEKPYQCIVCGRAFSQRSNVKKHMRSHKVWPSEISTLPEVHTIGVRLDANKQLIIRPTKSIDAVVEKREYRLLNNPNCDGSSQQTTEEPIVLVDNSFECRFCKQRFQDYYSLRSHMRQHKDQQVYLCVLSTCKRTFRELSAFLEHLEEHKRQREMIYACYMCKQQFASLYQLGEHYNQHRDSANSFSCPACKKSYSTVLHLQQHLAVCSHCHVCSHCDKGFASEAALRRHIAIHATIPQFQCHVCSRSFKTKGYLRFHLRSHQGDFPYSCSVCSKGFQRQDKLRQHEALHRPDQRLRCPLGQLSGCSYTCTRRDLLVQHVTSHWRWVHRPAACAICKYRFTSYRSLRRHQRMHRKRGTLVKRSQVCRQESPGSPDADLDADPDHHQEQPQLPVSPPGDMVCPLCSRQFLRRKPFDNHKLLCKQRATRAERCRKRRLAATQPTSSVVETELPVTLDVQPFSSSNHNPPAMALSSSPVATTDPPVPLTRASRRVKFTALWQPKKTRSTRKNRDHNQPASQPPPPPSSSDLIGGGRITTLVVKGNRLIGCSSSVVMDPLSSSKRRTLVHHRFDEGRPPQQVAGSSEYQLPSQMEAGVGGGMVAIQQTLPSIATLNPLKFVPTDSEPPVVVGGGGGFFAEPPTLSFLQSLDPLAGHTL